MGFYSIYRIIKDFFRKPFKTIIILIITLLIIFFFITHSFAVVSDYNPYFYIVGDVNYCMMMDYTIQEQTFLNICDFIISRGENQGSIAIINKFLNYVGKYGFSVYYETLEGFSYPQYIAYFYKPNDNTGSYTPHLSTYTVSGVKVDVPVVTHTLYYSVILSPYNMSVSEDTSAKTIEIPTNFFPYTSNLMREFVNKHYYKVDDKFDSQMDKIEQALAQMVIFQKSTSEDTKELLEEQKKLNDFLKKEDVDNNSYDFNTDNPTNDITESGFDNIFQQFYNAFTSDEKKKINIPIPFAEKNISFDSDFLYIALGQNSWIVETMKIFWLFLVSLYVVKDIERYIEKMKNGDIVSTTDTNIKTDML